MTRGPVRMGGAAARFLTARRAGTVRTVCAAALAAVVGVAAVPAPCTAAPGPADDSGAAERSAERSAGRADATAQARPVGELVAELGRLYREARTAGEEFSEADRRLREQQAEVGELHGELAQARAGLADGRRDAARLARRQYRQGGTGLPSFVRVLLSDDPQRTLDERHVLERLAAERAAAVGRLADGERRLDTVATRARRALDRQQSLAERRRQRREEVRDRLNAVAERLASLTPAELRALSQVTRAAQPPENAGRSPA
ncbi:hypothetical protein [Streptomyces sp. URMC 123]|uniref:hypothetical protein n=1 Tax=Streptomyces sp. URMC 123 TaxID=3423403 RepID=UPI003F1A7994